jgi:peptidoglycan/xylan/chitin deacetylase (PgdA/CDA1 family)
MLNHRTFPAALTFIVILFIGSHAGGYLSSDAEAAPASSIVVGDYHCVDSARLEATIYWQSSRTGQQWLDFSFYNNGFASGTFVGAGPLPPEQSSVTYNLAAGTTHYLRINTLTGSGWHASPTIFFTTPSCGAPVAPIGSVSLSFDDHADPYRVHGILDVLAANGVPAVFCITGDWARAYPDLIWRMQNEGHTLCNHTATHAVLTQLSDEGIRAEILGGVQSYLLRPPFGVYDARVAAIAASLGYQIYMWTIDARDWDGRSADSIVGTIMSSLHPEAVVLLHLHGPHTYEALPLIISTIRAQGYALN